MGLCNLKYIDGIIDKRRHWYELYNTLLTDKVRKPPTLGPHVKHNYMYYPMVCKNEKQLQATVLALNHQDIYPRRYFYPSLNDLLYIKDKQSCPISERIALSILCLPLDTYLEQEDVERICDIVNQTNES
jgi:dTDP-4-amino-4,6-dideoxygalactose transaminase